MFKITKSIINIPLIELHNYCIMNDLEVNLKDQEIILFEVYNEKINRL